GLHLCVIRRLAVKVRENRRFSRIQVSEPRPEYGIRRIYDCVTAFKIGAMNPPIRIVTLIEPTSASVIGRKRVSLFSRPLSNGSPVIMFSRVTPLFLLVCLCGGGFGQSHITGIDYYIV